MRSAAMRPTHRSRSLLPAPSMATGRPGPTGLLVLRHTADGGDELVGGAEPKRARSEADAASVTPSNNPWLSMELMATSPTRAVPVEKIAWPTDPADVTVDVVIRLVDALRLCGKDPGTIRRVFTFANLSRLIRQAETGRFWRVCLAPPHRVYQCSFAPCSASGVPERVSDGTAARSSCRVTLCCCLQSDGRCSRRRRRPERVRGHARCGTFLARSHCRIALMSHVGQGNSTTC